MARHPNAYDTKGNIDADVQDAKIAILRTLLPFLASVPIYGVVTWVMFRSSMDEVLASPMQTGPALGVLLAVLIATVLVLFVLPGLSAPERLAQQGLSSGQAIQSLMSSFAIRGAIVETVVVVGFILTFLNRQLHYILIGGIYAILMLLLLLVRRGSEFDQITTYFKE